MLSVVITTWNEAKNLPRAVASVKNLAGEIVVVDTGSTDDTVAIAEKLGCKIFHHSNTGIVEKVRNFSIQKARGDWILLLDSDEEIQPELAVHIKKVISENQVDYCRLARKNIIFGKWIKSEHWWPDYVYRLFKKGAISWQDNIHSIPITTGQGFDFPAQENLSVLHHNYQSISQYLDRMNRYTQFQSLELQESNTQFKWTDLINKPTQEFLSQYFARKGYLSGIHGLALSLLQGFSQLVVYLKLWELSKFKEQDIRINDLNKAAHESGKQFIWWYETYQILNTRGLKKIFWKIKHVFHL